jgi:co-chaperonin GroES (HSP10)
MTTVVQFDKLNGFVGYGRFLVCQIRELPDVTNGGIVRPEVAKKKIELLRVLSVGPDVTGDVKPGDSIVCEKFGKSILDGIEIALVHELMIIGIRREPRPAVTEQATGNGSVVCS